MKNDRLVLGLAITGGLAIYTALVFAFFSSEGESRQFYLFLIGMPLAVLLLAFPRAALVVLTVLVFFVRWLYDTIHAFPREINWLVDVLIVMLVLRALFLLPFHKEKIHGIVKFVFVLVAFGLLSAIVNHLERMVFIAGIRVGFRYLLLFVAATQMQTSPKWLRRYIAFLFVILLVQFPVVTSQFSEYGWSEPDRLSGTLGWGETPAMGIFLLTLLSYMVCKMLEEKRVRILYLAIIAAMSVLPILGEVKFYFLILPLLLLFMVRSEVLKRPAVAISMLIVGGLIMLGANYAILRTGAWLEGRNPLTMITNLPNVFNQEVEKGSRGTQTRSSMFLNALRLTMASPRMMLLGEGPGSVTESVISSGRSSKLAYYDQWRLTAVGTTSFNWLLIEYGYVGVILVFILLYWIYRRGRYLRASPDQQIRVFGRLLECTTFLYVAWIFYESAWTSDAVAFPYWPMAGLLVGLSFREQARQEKAAVEEIKSAAQPVLAAQPVPHR